MVLLIDDAVRLAVGELIERARKRPILWSAALRDTALGGDTTELRLADRRPGRLKRPRPERKGEFEYRVRNIIEKRECTARESELRALDDGASAAGLPISIGWGKLVAPTMRTRNISLDNLADRICREGLWGWPTRALLYGSSPSPDCDASVGALYFHRLHHACMRRR